MRVLPVISDAAESFAVFAHELSFTEAAARLYISQPALHKKINKFAEEVGETLYENRKGVLVLTPAGRELADFVDQLRRERDTFARTFDSSPNQPVVLAAGEGAFLYVLPEAIRKIISAPLGHLRLMTADGATAAALVQDGAADLGVAVLAAVPSALHAIPVLQTHQAVACPTAHPFAHRSHLTLGDLRDEPLIASPRGRPSRERLETTWEAFGATPNVIIEAAGWELLLSFVAMGAGCAIVNACVGNRPGVHLVPLTDLPPVTYVVLSRRRPAGGPNVRAVLDAIVHAA